MDDPLHRTSLRLAVERSWGRDPGLGDEASKVDDPLHRRSLRFAVERSWGRDPGLGDEVSKVDDPLHRRSLRFAVERSWGRDPVLGDERLRVDDAMNQRSPRAGVERRWGSGPVLGGALVLMLALAAAYLWWPAGAEPGFHVEAGDGPVAHEVLEEPPEGMVASVSPERDRRALDTPYRLEVTSEGPPQNTPKIDRSRKPARTTRIVGTIFPAWGNHLSGTLSLVDPNGGGRRIDSCSFSSGERFELWSSGSYGLAIQAKVGSSPFYQVLVRNQRLAGEVVDVGVLFPVRGQRVEGRVFRTSGLGLGAAMVDLEQQVGYAGFDPDKAARMGKVSTTTDASGAFGFGDVPPGIYVITVTRTGYVQSRQIYRMQPGKKSQTSISVTMHPGATGWLCKGRVVGEGGKGKGVAGVSIRLLRGRDRAAGRGTVTNALGYFEIRTPLRHFFVEVEKKGYAWMRLGPHAPHSWRPTIVIQRGHRFEVRVDCEEGELESSAQVTLTCEKGVSRGRFLVLPTDSTGRLVIEDLGAGSWILHATHPERGSTGTVLADGVGQLESVRLLFRSPPTVFFDVATDRGIPLVGAELVVRQLDWQGSDAVVEDVRKVVLDDQGHGSVEVKPGCTLLWKIQDPLTQFVQTGSLEANLIAIDGPRCRVRISRDGVVEGSMMMPRGKGLGLPVLQLVRAEGGQPLTLPVRRDKDGNLGFRVLRIPHGSYRLRVVAPSGANAETGLLAESEGAVQVQAGKILRLRCKLVTR